MGQGEFRERIIVSSMPICLKDKIFNKKLFEGILLTEGEKYSVYNTLWLGEESEPETFNLVGEGEILTLTPNADLTAGLNSYYNLWHVLKVENYSPPLLMDVEIGGETQENKRKNDLNDLRINKCHRYD